MSDKYKNLKVKELQELLQKRDLPTTGKKEELIDRLVKHDEKEAKELKSLEEEFGDLEDFDESKVPLDSTELEDILGDDSKDETAATTDASTPAPAKETKTTTSADKANEAATKAETATNTAAENNDTSKDAKKDDAQTKPNSNFKFTPITFDKKPTTNTTATTTNTTTTAASKPSTPPAASASQSKPVTKLDDAERALERAKRFGIQLNEKAKKDIRAQRFGINTNKQEVKKSQKLGADPDVLKKRAERFGISNTSATVAASKGKVPANVDPVEEEKKRKRAERFNMEANKKQKAE